MFLDSNTVVIVIHLQSCCENNMWLCTLKFKASIPKHS